MSSRSSFPYLIYQLNKWLAVIFKSVLPCYSDYTLHDRNVINGCNPSIHLTLSPFLRIEPFRKVFVVSLFSVPWIIYIIVGHEWLGSPKRSYIFMQPSKLVRKWLFLEWGMWRNMREGGKHRSSVILRLFAVGKTLEWCGVDVESLGSSLITLEIIHVSRVRKVEFLRN